MSVKALLETLIALVKAFFEIIINLLGKFLTMITSQGVANFATVVGNAAVFIGVVIALLSLFLSYQSLFNQFIKPAEIKLKIGKSAILIWHDNGIPTIDVQSSVLNEGAQSLVIDKIELELSKDGKKTNFIPYLFFKPQTTFHYIESQDRFVSNESWVTEAYAHPIILTGHSEKSRKIGFRTEDFEYAFTAGKYNLIVEALTEKNVVIAQDNAYFELTEGQVNTIKQHKGNVINPTLEVPLIEG